MKKLFITTFLLSPLACLANNEVTGGEATVAFAPIIFFVLILALTILKLRKDDTTLSDLIAEKDVPAAGTPPSDTTPPSQSVSRFIVFITGLVALAVGSSLCTFFMYRYFQDPTKPADMSNLTTVIWGLGIGVIPYGFNKTASALK